MEYIIATVIAGTLLMQVFKRGAGHAHAGGDGCCGSAGAKLPQVKKVPAQVTEAGCCGGGGADQQAVQGDAHIDTADGGCCGGGAHAHEAETGGAHAKASEAGCCGGSGATHEEDNGKRPVGEVQP